jgi:rSAM/selenodomain-associated transferase 1
MNAATADFVHALIVAKAPEPGWTKTRLAATIGPRQAADLSAAALLDTVRACQSAFGVERCQVSLAGSLDRAVQAEPIRSALTGWTVREQRGGDFADRLIRAHREVPGSIVQVGTDTPQVTPGLLRTVANLLDSADAVLGPATDGGWWVLALRDPGNAACLRDVPMSTSATGEQTRAALESAGLSVALAPELRDVDVVEDAAAVASAAPWTEFSRQWSLLAASA